MGIDPGTIIMGYGLIEIKGTSMQLLDMNVLKLSAKIDAYEKLEKIHFRIQQLILEYKPDYFAIEAPFFGKNVQSMLKLGRAQGVAIAAAMRHGLTVTEYSPKKVKQSVTGNGNADKEQVLKMLQRLLGFKDVPTSHDASDALAVAVCHYFQEKTVQTAAGNKVTGWDDFIKKNPEKLKK